MATTRRVQLQLFRVRYWKSLNTRAGFSVVFKLRFGLSHFFRNLSLETVVLGQPDHVMRADGPHTNGVTHPGKSRNRPG